MRTGLDNQDIDQVILDFLQGEATTDEIEILRKWLREDKENQAVFESVKRYWENSTPGVKSMDTDQAYARLRSTSFTLPSTHQIPIREQSPRSGLKWYKAAAVLIAFLTLSFAVYFLVGQKNSGLTVVREIVKENPKGQKLTTYLPDGSKIILNSLSRIKYQTPFVGNERLIELDGEAFFEVKKDTLKPFKVISGGVTTTALGTSFNVNNKYHEQVEVVLVSGRVEVSRGPESFVILSPGKSAVVDRKGEFVVEKFEYLDKVGWKDGILVFNNNSLPEVIDKIEDWYGVEFVAETELTERFHYTGTYKNESLEEVLQGISFVHHFEYKLLGDTVKIYLMN